MYYIDAQQGFYYAVLTDKTIRAFYLDSTGNTIYVTAYRWDLNTSWIIFQAPLSTRIYLREESYTMPTFSTPANWFSGNPAPATPYYNITVSFPTPWNRTSFTTIYPQNSTIEIVKWFDGSKVVVRNTTTYNFNNTYTLSLNASVKNTWVSTSTTYTASISVVQVNSPPAVLLSAAPRGAYFTRFAGYASCYHGYKYDRLVQSVSFSNERYNIYEVTLAYTNSSTSVLITTSSTTLQESTTCSSAIQYDGYDAIYNYYIVNLNLTLSQPSVSFLAEKQYIQSNNIITTDANNKIYIAGALETLPYANLIGSSSSSTYYVYTRSTTINSTNQDWVRPIVLIYSSANDTQLVRNPNPAAILYSPLTGVAPTWLFNYGSSLTVAVVNPPSVYNSSLITLDLVYTYPTRYTKPNLEIIVAQGSEIVSLFPVGGYIQASTSYVYINGSIDLSNYVGSTVILGMNGNYSISGQAQTGYIGSYLAIYPQASGVQVSGTFNLSLAVILYNIATMMNYTYAIDALQLKQVSADKIQYAVSGQITGSWQYRIPISINLMELPTSFQETGFLFRLILPTQTWINNGLLCSNLEDLIIVDGSGKPLAFYILRQGATSVVYVRYDAVITTTQIIIYVLLKNQALCGTGNSFSTLSAFDAVDPRDFVDDFGYNVYFNYFSWNLLVFIPQSTDASLKAGSSFYDAVEINSTAVWARHGSLIVSQQVLNQSVWNVNDEIIAVVARPNFDSLLIYKNGEPVFAIDLKDVDASPGQWVGWKGGKVYAGKMLMYSYSIGQIIGGFSVPKSIGPEQPKQSQASEVNWWSVIGALIPLIVIAVIFRLIENPPAGGRSGRSGGDLPW